MKKNNNLKAWLYLLPAILFLGVFMVYPLIDVFFYSVEENYHSISQTYTGVGLGNFGHVLSDPYFIQALKNTFILVIITVPLSTGTAFAMAESGIKIPAFTAYRINAISLENMNRTRGVDNAMHNLVMACVQAREVLEQYRSDHRWFGCSGRRKH